MAPVVTQLPINACSLGEGPHWDSDDNSLYFVDIVKATINKYEADTGKHVEAKLDVTSHFIIPVEGKKHHFVITQGRKVVEIKWTADENPPKILRTITETEPEFPKHVLNDGKADPLGRLFTGIIVDDVLAPNRAKDGSLYRIDPDGTTNKVASGIVCSNGLCWDLKEKAFYYIDSLTFTVQRFDYDVETGNISNPTVAFSFEKHGLTSSPDGMTIDTDGNLWVAAFWETGMLKIDPRQNKVVEKIPLPVAQVASATFGGPNLDVLYVTTASLALEGRPEQHPPAGSTYAITGMNARGYPNLKVRLY